MYQTGVNIIQTNRTWSYFTLLLPRDAQSVGTSTLPMGFHPVTVKHVGGTPVSNLSAIYRSFKTKKNTVTVTKKHKYVIFIKNILGLPKMALHLRKFPQKTCLAQESHGRYGSFLHKINFSNKRGFVGKLFGESPFLGRVHRRWLCTISGTII